MEPHENETTSLITEEILAPLPTEDMLIVCLECNKQVIGFSSNISDYKKTRFYKYMQSKGVGILPDICALVAKYIPTAYGVPWELICLMQEFSNPPEVPEDIQGRNVEIAKFYLEHALNSAVGGNDSVA